MKLILSTFPPRNLFPPAWMLICALWMTACSPAEAPPPNEPEDTNGPELTLQTEFGSVNTLSVATDDIFAIWWDPAFNHADDLPIMFGWLKDIRKDCIENLNMADPPNPAAGFFYNLYIHHGQDDILPDGWGNGQGTDTYGMPLLTLPDGAHVDRSNILHEGFHIFQYAATSPGFAYAGDSQWYTESAAQWYMAKNMPTGEGAFIEAGAITANPHLALWHSFSNEAPGDATDWFFQVRQYGMHTYLYYLTEVAGVDADIISGGFYAQTDLSPQQYHYDKIGGDQLRGYFADWAARNTGGFDYLTSAQLDRARVEAEASGDANNSHPFVLELTNDNASGVHTPPSSLKPRSWSYNVIKINNTQSKTFTINLLGEERGSDGALAHFEGRIVVKGNAGTRYQPIVMDNALSGTATIAVESTDTEVFVVIASLPAHFTGNQTYPYEVNISQD
jgi:hypothetical protein